MSDPPRSAAQLQQWMQAVITHIGGIDAGIASDEAQRAFPLGGDCLEEVILPSRAQTAVERLAVYGNAYYARLLHCLRDLFPACRQAVGDDIFDEFAIGYLQEHPPRSYTLGRLANAFVEFLDQTRQEHFADESATDATTWSRFVVELARLEHVIDEVFDGPGIEHDPPTVGQQLALLPPESWPQARIAPVVCLRFLKFDFPVNEYYSAFRRGESPDVPAPARTYVAITRRNYIVRRYTLEERQFRLLNALAAGQTLGEAIAAAAGQATDLESLSASLPEWFATWGREQFFVRIDTSVNASQSGEMK